MKTKHRLSFNLALAILLIVPLGFVSPASATSQVIVNPDGSIIYLNGVLSGYSDSRFTDMNDRSQLTGYSYTSTEDRRAFITGSNGEGITNIGTLGGNYSDAAGINTYGQVIGTSTKSNGEFRSFITGPNGSEMTILINDDPESDWVFPARINASGQVVGSISPYPRSFMTGPSGSGVRDILPGYISQATDINNAGQVVGIAFPGIMGPPRQDFSYITGPNGMDIHHLPDGARVSAINNEGQAAGTYRPAASSNDAFAFFTNPEDNSLTRINGFGGAHSAANDINDAGQVVGFYLAVNGNEHAFITGPDGKNMMDLNTLVVNLPEGNYLESASIINNRGQVLASLVPEPRSYILMLVGLGLMILTMRYQKKERFV